MNAMRERCVFVLSKSFLTSNAFFPLLSPISPYIVILDSLGGYHPAVSKALRSYLQQELSARKGIKRTLSMNDVIGKYAKVRIPLHATTILMHESYIIFRKVEDPDTIVLVFMI